MYKVQNNSKGLNDLLAQGEAVVCGDAQPFGGGAFFGNEFWSTSFPPWLSKSEIPIHVKEFWVVVVSVMLWGEQWRGRPVYIFSDNTAVVNVLDREKPRDPALQQLLREFLYVVCTRSFTPFIRHIGTEENKIADFLSRNHDDQLLFQFLQKNSPNLKHRLKVPNSAFSLNSLW